jgi:type I restriction enzyme S subunit
MLWLSRKGTHRWAGFVSWGSTRDVFTFDDLSSLKIPIPNIEIQRSIANIYNVYVMRCSLNEKLKEQIKNLCPILIKGSLEEANTESRFKYV